MVSIGHPLPREFLDGHRRMRLAGAVSELAHDEGLGGLTVTAIAARAGGSRSTFYELFADRDACVEFACQEAERRLFEPVREVLAVERAWPERLGAAIEALLGATVAAPRFAELCLIHSAALPGAAGSGAEAGVPTMIATLEGGRAAGRAALGAGYVEPPASIEELVARGVLSVVAMRLGAGEVDTLPSLIRELTILAAGPFLGTERANELGRTAAA